MKVTVCELGNDPQSLSDDWQRLGEHVREHRSELVVLPEMPFAPWLARTREVDASAWQAAVVAHDHWIERLAELGAGVVISTRPTADHHNEGFVWQRDRGYQPVHTKYYLPDEAGYWEASWYQRGDGVFEATHCAAGHIGLLICSELWFTRHARDYAKQGVELIVCPRVTPGPSTEMWLSGGQGAAIISGAFCLSSNLRGPGTGDLAPGGTGWIIEPEYGRVLGTTSEEHPFLTLEIDLQISQNAKATYPRYISD